VIVQRARAAERDNVEPASGRREAGQRVNEHQRRTKQHHIMTDREESKDVSVHNNFCLGIHGSTSKPQYNPGNHGITR